MGAIGIGTNVVQPHFLFCPTRLRLEENSLSMSAPGTRVVLCPWQCGIGDNISNDLCELTRKYNIS